MSETIKKKSKVKLILVAIRKFIFEKDKNDVGDVPKEIYKKDFIRDKKINKEAYNKAWETRNFEIDLYWKRAAYFWAFQAASFTGYFAVLNSEYYKLAHHNEKQILFFVICIGIVTSTALTLINIGSKNWQRHWEIHIDYLEDTFSGPLYKTISSKKTYSVSKINEIVSIFFVLIWFLLGIKYCFDNLTLCGEESNGIDLYVIAGTVASSIFIFSMFFGHGRGRFGKRNTEFYRRNFEL